MELERIIFIDDWKLKESDLLKALRETKYSIEVYSHPSQIGLIYRSIENSHPVAILINTEAITFDSYEIARRIKDKFDNLYIMGVFSEKSDSNKWYEFGGDRIVDSYVIRRNRLGFEDIIEEEVMEHL